MVVLECAISQCALESTIEDKRKILYDLVLSIGDLTHPLIVQISQEIDDYMVQLQKMKLTK